ncbi:unnamed protein product [Caenorhabditis bovis]|uniref:BPTI/Kunitz inhibitor domain-containing protein n=1 Tax=Caenorhabditis bovis TaxID=2654633 RepID=A0A8S1ENR5_9PELO|nr:unnamed protein product [Caenorhabditis bovis]
MHVSVINHVRPYCEEGAVCEDCELVIVGQPCNSFDRLPVYYCNNNTRRVIYEPSKYFMCVDGEVIQFDCSYRNMPAAVFNQITRECVQEEEFKRRRRATTGSARVGDVCSFNTDCQRGMFCGGGVCSCLSDFVSISQHCWPKVNPGESGCVENRQCEAVWPGTTCNSAGLCECPRDTVPSRTRDGTVCISSKIPPSCPLPEPHNGNPNPATVLANPTTHPLNPGSYTPVLCNSLSSETRVSNGGDGSTWCVYPDGDNDIYIADTYNCISHPQVNNELFPEYAETVDGVCCHNRAFVCIQPLESGDEPSVPRWWYNSATGTCVQFMWDPDTITNASPNNFRTAEHCESYCRDTCRRGAPEFAGAKYSILDEVPRTNCLASTSRCDSEHQCTLIGSQQTCCPTPAHICSAHGGRMMLTKPVENYDRGVQIAGSKASTRYYYDVDQGRCVNFLYHGLGNFNNFLTKQDCESFCSKLVCENGNPLRIGEEWQRCETNADCPTSHTCQGSHKVCCPTAQSLCTQPKRLGDCTSSVRRYWYNAATRTCEMFQYTGCQGNDNNFPTLVACQQRCRGINVEPKCQHGRAFRDRNGSFQQCSDKSNGPKCPVNYVCSFDGTTHGCCPTKAFTCSLNPDKGVQCGSGRSYRYYFNSNKQSCETFQYEGCDGNSNNFLTSEDCQSYCGVGGCPNGGMPLRDEKTNRPMQCSELKTCPSTHECISIPINGNVGNRCCPTKSHICSQPPQQGNHCSKISVARYYFNIVTRECASFQFNGCNGNLNNFATQAECNNFCSSAGCAVGEVAYKDVNTKKAYDCNNVLINSCPANFQCRFNSLTSGYVCCGSTSMDVCPPEERAFINALDESVRECAINVPGSCPSDFLCRFNAQRNRYYCCAPTTENVCPDGRALFRAAKTHLPIRCTLNTPNSCPDGYSCQSRAKNVLQGFCCSARNVCKGDAEFLMDEKTKMPRICTPGAFISCPNGYRCHKSLPSSVSGFCCKGEINAISEGCPPGEYAYARKNEIIACDPFNPENKGCPATFSCQFAVAFQRYQCCGKDPIEEDEIEQEELGCPHSQVALVEDNHPVVCTASANTCPTGYFCQFSDKNKQFQCCGHKSGCPGESVAYLDLSGQAQECSRKLGNCPSGYSCQSTRAGKTVCCTGGVTRISSRDRPMITGNSSTVPTTTPTAQNSTVAAVTTTTAKSLCPPDTVLINGECKVRGAVGSVCLLSSQCTSGAECLNQFCSCSKKFRQQEGRCVQILDEENECKKGEVKKDGRCYPTFGIGGGDCQFDSQCLNGTICTENVCKCAPGSSPYKERCLNNVNICESPKQPVISNNSLIICAKQKCPKPSQCLYSKLISSYVCCSVAPVPVRPATARPVVRGRPVPSKKYTCPDGRQPMMFPQNHMPLVCNVIKGCPQGYTCIAKMCCPNTRVKREPCPRGYLELVRNDGTTTCVLEMHLNFTALEWVKCPEYENYPIHIIAAIVAIFAIIANGYIMKLFIVKEAIGLFLLAIFDFMFAFDFITTATLKSLAYFWKSSELNKWQFHFGGLSDRFDEQVRNLVAVTLFLLAVERLLWTFGERTRQRFGLFTDDRSKIRIIIIPFIVTIIFRFLDDRFNEKSLLNQCTEFHSRNKNILIKGFDKFLDTTYPWISRAFYALALIISLISVVRKSKTGKGELAVSQSHQTQTTNQDSETGIRLVNRSILCMFVIILTYLVTYSANEFIRYDFPPKDLKQFGYRYFIVKLIELFFVAARFFIYFALTKFQIVYQYFGIILHT